MSDMAFALTGLDLSSWPDVPGTQAGGSLQSVIELRIEHVSRGYTPAEDAQLPDCFLEDKAERYIYRAKLQRRKYKQQDDRKSLELARGNYARAAALLLAQIDRIDFILVSDQEGRDQASQTEELDNGKEAHTQI